MLPVAHTRHGTFHRSNLLWTARSSSRAHAPRAWRPDVSTPVCHTSCSTCSLSCSYCVAEYGVAPRRAPPAAAACRGGRDPPPPRTAAAASRAQTDGRIHARGHGAPAVRLVLWFPRAKTQTQGDQILSTVQPGRRAPPLLDGVDCAKREAPQRCLPVLYSVRRDRDPAARRTGAAAPPAGTDRGPIKSK